MRTRDAIVCGLQRVSLLSPYLKYNRHETAPCVSAPTGLYIYNIYWQLRVQSIHLRCINIIELPYDVNKLIRVLVFDKPIRICNQQTCRASLSTAPCETHFQRPQVLDFFASFFCALHRVFARCGERLRGFSLQIILCTIKKSLRKLAHDRRLRGSRDLKFLNIRKLEHFFC
jgi:hypothetical protein